MESKIDRQDILNKLHDHLDEMTQRFDVASLGIFGSLSRDEATGHSDVDILVDFHHQATFRGYFALKFYLEELLGHPVDLVTRQALKERLRPYVERDLIHVA